MFRSCVKPICNTRPGWQLCSSKARRGSLRTMETDWDRAEHVHLSPQEVVDLLAPVLPATAIGDYELLASGRANTNYRIHTTGGDLVLRLYTRDRDACARETAILELAGSLVPVPVVLHASPDPDGDTPPYVIETWLEGRRPDAVIQAEPSLARAVGIALGRAAGSILTQTFARSGFLNAAASLQVGTPLPDFESYIVSCFEEQGGVVRVGEDFAKRVIAFVRRNLVYVPGDLDGVSLVHGDFKPSNLLVDPEDGHLTGVLDWEFAFAGSPLFDLATLLRESASLPPTFEHGVIDGYEAPGRRLPPHWRRTVRLLDLANLCTFLTGSAEHGPASGSARRVRDVRDAIERTMGDWEGLA
jgi:aminoglycoside phosphotransferase (APT) family kinase protein